MGSSLDVQVVLVHVPLQVTKCAPNNAVLHLTQFFFRPREEKGFVSRTCAHEYVDSLLLHSPMHQAQLLAFFFFFCGCQQKIDKNGREAGEKKWAKNTIKKRIPMFRIAHFLKKKKKKKKKKKEKEKA